MQLRNLSLVENIRHNPFEPPAKAGEKVETANVTFNLRRRVNLRKLKGVCSVLKLHVEERSSGKRKALHIPGGKWGIIYQPLGALKSRKPSFKIYAVDKGPDLHGALTPVQRRLIVGFFEALASRN